MKIVPSFIRNYFGKRWFGIPGESGEGFVDNLGVQPAQNQRQVLQEYIGLASLCVSSRAEEVASIENYAYQELQDGSTKRLPKNEFLKLLEKPNPEMTKFELFEATQSFIDMVGEVFWYFSLGEQTGKPKGIYTIRPDRMKVVVDKGYIVGYKLMKNGADGQFLMPEEVYHWKTFNPNNAYRGIGILQRALDYVGTERFASRFSLNFLRNNATPAGVLTLDGSMKKEAFQKFKRQWREGLSGAENAGKIAIVRGATAKFEKIGLSLQDIDLKALKDVTADDVFKMFKVPKPLVGLADAQGLGRSNVETLEYIYMKRTINPQMKRIDDGLEKLNERFYKENGTMIGHENIVPEDKDYELTRLEKGTDKWIQRDEARVADGLKPVGANQLFIGLNQVPVDLDSTASKGVEKKARLIIRVPKTQKKKGGIDWDVTDKSDDAPQEVFRKNTVEVTALGYEKKLKKAFVKYLSEQEDKVLSIVDPKKKLTAKDYHDPPFDKAEETAKLMLALTPIIITLAQDIGEQGMTFVGADGEFIMSPAFDKLLKDHLYKMSYKFNDETIDQLSKTLAEGLKAGESNDKLAKRVNGVYDDAKKWRNKRVSRSETHWTAVNATEEAYKQSEWVHYKKWYANPGACEFCLSFDGKTEPIGHSFWPQGKEVEGTEGGTFNPDYETVENAHLHPNCKCQLLPMESKE